MDDRMFKPALIGGVLLGVLSALPVIGAFNCFCCAWVIGGGILASYLYVKDSPVPVTLGRGTGLGLFTGVIGAVVIALFSIPLSMLMNRSGMGIAEQMKETMDRMPNVPPETRQMLENLTHEGAEVYIMIMGMIFVLIISCLFAMIGGTVGVAIFEKRKPGSTLPPSPQYQPPPPPPDAA